MTATKILNPAAGASRYVPERVYCSDLTPLDYARMVHPRGTAGAVSLCGPSVSKRTGKPCWHDSRYSAYALATRECDVGKHRFMSFATWPRQEPGQPKAKRTAANAVSVGASWVDLDFYNRPDWRDVPHHIVLEAVRNVCEERGWPMPSYATCSGRGLLIVWLYKAQPAQVVSGRHRAIQETLHQSFLHMGSDPSAKTLTKVFRMPKTRNERNGTFVGILWPTYIREIQRTDFDVLAGAVLPYRRKTRKEKEAEAAAARAERTSKALSARKPREQHAGAVLGGRSYWATLREDLERLFALRHGAGPVPDGEGRNKWILAMAYAAAWDMPASKLTGYIEDQAARCGLTRDEALAKTHSVRERAAAAARGEKTVRSGRSFDPRYRPGPGFFISDDLLDITSREMRKANLRMLVDANRRAENAKGRVVKARRAAGVKDRADQQALRLQVGRQVEEMVELGISHADVAALYGASRRWVTNALRDARAMAAIGKTTEKATAPSTHEPQVAPVITVDDVADTLDAPPTPPAHEVLRGTRKKEESVAIGVVAVEQTSYSPIVTTKGCTFPSRPTPAARPPARRALPCLALAMAEA